MSYLPLRTMLLSDDLSTSYLTRLKDLAFLSLERGAIVRIWYINYTETPPLNLLCYRHLKAHEPIKMQLHPICRSGRFFYKGQIVYHNPHSWILKNIPTVVRLNRNSVIVKAKTEKGAFAGEKTMKDLIPLGLGAYDSDSDEEFLVEYDAYIRAEARKAAAGLFAKGVFGWEADELAQTIRIKLWNARRKHTIKNPPAYIRIVAHTTAVDMIRRHRSSIPLSTDADGELSLGNLLVAGNEGFQDPAYEIELVEIDPYFLKKLVQEILSLPPRQRQSLLFSLKECCEEGLLLIKAFKAQGLDIEILDFPDEKREVHLLKASLSVARKKLWSLREKETVT